MPATRAKAAAARGNGFVGDGDKIGAGDHHADDIDGENGEHGLHIDHRLTACKKGNLVL